MSTMLAKITVAVLCLYVVQAAFIINAPVDDDEATKFEFRRSSEVDESDVADDSEDGSSARACVYESCNRSCRSRGFAMGRCITPNICRCYRRRMGFAENEELNENEVDVKKNEEENAKEVEDFTVEQMTSEDSSEATSSLSSARACTHAFCNAFCRSRGYAWGHCISANICRCYRFRMTPSDNVEASENAVDIHKNEDENVKELEDFTVAQMTSEDGSESASSLSSARACTHAFCNAFCRSRGYAWGHCISANICRCYRYRMTLSENEEASENVADINKNDDETVKDLEDFTVAQMTSEDRSEAASSLSSARACTHAFCNAFCRSRGYAWGHCISANICRCYRFRLGLSENVNEIENSVEINKNEDKNKNEINENADTAEDFNIRNLVSEDGSEAASSLSSARACTHPLCNAFCRSRGYAWGHCISANICRCYRFRMTPSENNEASENAVDINKNEDENVKELADFTVAQMTSEDGSEAPSSLSSARACTHPLCNAFCRSRGYAWGHCISANICRCYRFRMTPSENEEASDNAVDINKNQDENVKELEDFTVAQMTSEDGSEATSSLSSARACTHAFCNAFCRSRGYAWGHCISANICRCYRFRLGLSENVNEIENSVDINKNEKENKNKINENADTGEDFNIRNLVLEDGSEAASSLSSARACTHPLCNAFCRSRGYAWGHCISANICRCYRFRMTTSENEEASENAVDINKNEDENVKELEDFTVAQMTSEDGSEAPSSLSSARACTHPFCNAFCRSRGYAWGHCISANICRCYRFRMTPSQNEEASDNGVDINKNGDENAKELGGFNAAKMTSEDGSEVNSPKTLQAKCQYYQCTQTCRRMHYRGGSCIGDSCICFM